MTVLTATRTAAFTRQLTLPFATAVNHATRATRGTGSARPLREPPRGVAKAVALATDKPGGP